MEFLKELFGDGQALTYTQLSEAVKGKGFQVVNAAGGAYVPKNQVDTLTTQLGEANKKLEGYDPSWKQKAEDAQRQLTAQQFDFALEKAVAASGPRNARAVMGLLDREKLTFTGGEVVGLDKQLEEMKKSPETSFLFEESKSMRTGMNHQNAGEVGSGTDKKEMANAALRSLIGRAE